MLLQASYTFRARLWPIWIIALVLVGPFLLLFIHDPQDKRIHFLLILPILICVALFIIEQYHKIYIDDQILQVQTILNKKAIRWKSITRSYISWHIDIHTAAPLWHFESTEHNNFFITFGYFSRNDMQIIAQQLIDKAPKARIDDKVINMAHGKFPWYVF